VVPVLSVGMVDQIRTTGDVSILLLRHGQSEWNAVMRWQGTFDSSLTELGRAQALDTARLLVDLDVKFSALWASDLSRAAETGSIIGRALRLGAPQIEPRIREAHAGEWEGMTPDEIESGWPGWLDAHRRPPSFEPFHTVAERCSEALLDIARSTVKTGSDQASVLVVAHSGVIRTMIRHLGGHDDRVPNLGGIWLEATLDTTEGEPAGLRRGALFDPTGITISGVDAPGEEPGDERGEQPEPSLVAADTTPTLRHRYPPA
jgi:broad specificity phosphatase PhoE